MLKLIALIAWRYLRKSHEKNISFMIALCFFGIFMGTFALALVTCIMNGFEKVTQKKLQGIHSQLIMRSSHNQSLDIQKIYPVLEKEFFQIKSYSPTNFKQLLLHNKSTNSVSNALVMKIIDPLLEPQVSTIQNYIVKSNNEPQLLANVLDKNSIIIGNKLAQELDLKIGDSVELLLISQQEITGKKISFTSYTVFISALFCTGIEEFDNGLLLGSFELAKKVFSESDTTQINIQLKANVSENEVIQKLQTRFGLQVFSWKELYPALVSALKLEKYAMFFILALITLIASLNIISLITLNIIQKKSDIAIYHAMGMHRNSIIAIFMFISMVISIIASVLGLLSAYGIGLLLEKYPFITLPDSYYVSHLPITMELPIFIITFLLVVIITFIASLISCRNIKSIHVAHILRSEH